MTTENINELRLAANALRILSIDAVQAANSGHPGLPLGMADVVTVLWTKIMKHNPKQPKWFDRDRFILSAGHGSALLYALLYLNGYPMPLEELKQFRQWGSITPGHPEYDPEIGIEMTTGPLGQGISTAVGIALAEKWFEARYNKQNFEIVNHYTFVLASDGDLMEGVSHEAASLAGHLGLNKLIVLYDDNQISIDGSTELAYTDDVLMRFKAYGWNVDRIDGHNYQEIEDAILRAKKCEDKPTIIACKTHIGYASPLQDTSKVHGSPLGEEGVMETREKLMWPYKEPFFVPDEVKDYFEAHAQKGTQANIAWDALVERYKEAYPALYDEFTLIVAGKLPDGWDAGMPDFSRGEADATRNLSLRVLDSFFEKLPMMIGGSADLTGSNKTKPKNVNVINTGSFNGRYIHYGVREHGMGAIMNGLALHNLRPYGGTFLVFSDYMRPSIRLAALMKLPVIYVFTHDSIGLGEDGPTHQPIEQLLSLRTVPNLVVIRPADGNETSVAWKVAIERVDGPTALILTRQSLSQITPFRNRLSKGAYVLSETLEKPDVILIGSGSEVEIALEAKELLAEKGVHARVVSMPSWELFEMQSEIYRKSVLNPGIPKVAIEAGTTLAWQKYVGDKGCVIGIDRFGASAPYSILYEKFGFTAENVVEKTVKLLESVS